MTTKDTVIAEITKFVDQVTLDETNGLLLLESNLRNDLGIDSLEEIEIVMNLEKHFNINVIDAEAEKIRTVGDVVLLIEKTIKEAA